MLGWPSLPWMYVRVVTVVVAESAERVSSHGESTVVNYKLQVYWLYYYSPSVAERPHTLVPSNDRCTYTEESSC